jgi:hypothetical protein
VTESKPKIFISSTIYDFQDLRSALKFWLEELGYEVLTSENPDFPVQADLSSYETCLSAIDDCQYFILLIGGRVGGWYNEADRVSITQAEYRRAYERLQGGKLKLNVFVREAVWTLKEDRSALERFLRSEALTDRELTEDQVHKITTHPSKFVNDARFISDFLREIGHHDEMIQAIREQATFPIGNWIHVFSQFNDIVNSLRVALRIKQSLRREVLTTNLKSEIESNLVVLIGRVEDNENGDNPLLLPIYNWASYARGSLKGGINNKSQYRGQHLRRLAIYAKIFRSANKLSTDALDQSIFSGEFLEFNYQMDSFMSGKLQDALMSLKRNINQLLMNEEMMTEEYRMSFDKYGQECRDDTQYSVDNLYLLPIFAVHDSQVNVVNLSHALYRALEGDFTKFDSLQLYDNSPLHVENEQIQRERPSNSEIKEWLK